MMVSFGHP
uniref:Uncharacterized protein n=1 Tax=Moniliophthora roreri TaxID=221103 RepID=A0A0W0FWZ9_MONRR